MRRIVVVSSRSEVVSEATHANLLATGKATLVEGNSWGDTFWGVCRGKGKNMLGKILMRVRKRLATIVQQSLSEST